FQTLIATKAARVCLAAQGEPVIEFGLRRAQGIDGAVSAARAAYIGGCAATSDVLAGKLLGIPVRGTHAHSWVMLFDSEREAFAAYAKAMPHNVVLLVDTYDSLQGVRNAIETGRWLRSQGRELSGIRLDSGDLAWLSIEARKLLDAAGFTKTVIFASNELEEGRPSRTRGDMQQPPRRKTVPEDASQEDLLVPVTRAGRIVYNPPPLAESAARAARQLEHLHAGIKRLVNPHRYPVGLDPTLHDRRTKMILEARGR